MINEAQPRRSTHADIVSMYKLPVRNYLTAFGIVTAVGVTTGLLAQPQSENYGQNNAAVANRVISTSMQPESKPTIKPRMVFTTPTPQK